MSVFIKPCMTFILCFLLSFSVCIASAKDVPVKLGHLRSQQIHQASHLSLLCDAAFHGGSSFPFVFWFPKQSVVVVVGILAEGGRSTSGEMVAPPIASERANKMDGAIVNTQ